jgi:cytochrome c556
LSGKEWIVPSAERSAEVRRLKKETIMQDEDMVHLANARNPVEANIWRQALEEEGISCTVVGDLLEAGIGNVGSVTPEVWVHAHDLERARAFLAAHHGAAEEPEADDA